jgi:hypothetical protein
MPNLKHLHISLSVEEDVSFIMEHLPGLDTLNGIQVETQSDEGSNSAKAEQVGSSQDQSQILETPANQSPIQEEPQLDQEYILAQASKYA